MNEQISPLVPHRNWILPHKTRAVDTLGVAVALVFLVTITVLAGGRGEKTAEENGSQEQPVHSTQVDVRSSSKGVLESDGATPAQSMTGLRQELEDPRRGE